MNLLPKTPLRHILLVFIGLLALGLRLWGLDWGTDHLLDTDPKFRGIIEYLSLSNLTAQDTWNQAFFSLAALLKGFLSFVGGFSAYVLGLVKDPTEVVIPGYIAGRLTVALLGTGQVFLAYLVGKRAFDSPSAGLLAASLVACHPLLTIQSHYLTLDIPLGFSLLACILIAWHLAENIKPGVCFWAGFVLGLTITVRVGGIMAIPVIVLAFFFGIGRNRPTRLKGTLILPACLIAGLAIGLIIGYPGFVLAPYRTENLLIATLNQDLMAGDQFWSQVLWERISNTLLAFKQGALIIPALLWLQGALLIIISRPIRRLILLIVPPLSILAGLIILPSDPMSLAAVWLPSALVVAVWPLVKFCRFMPNYNIGAGLASGICVLVCAFPFWLSLEADYLFWQEAPLSSCRVWLKENRLPETKVFLSPVLPKATVSKAQTLKSPISSGTLLRNKGILVSLKKQEKNSEKKKLQLLKQFDLKTAENLPLTHKSFYLYSGHIASRIKQPLALLRPGVDVDRKHGVIYGDYTDYSLNSGLLRLNRPGSWWRSLYLEKKPDIIYVTLSNQGDDLAQAEFKQGPFSTQKVTLYPGQTKELSFTPQAWPPMAQGFFPFKASLQRGNDFHVGILWDSLKVAKKYLDKGNFKEAQILLSSLLKKRRLGFEGKTMLAESLARQKKFKQATEILRNLGAFRKNSVPTYVTLSQTIKPGKKWDAKFKRYTGYHPDLLRNSTTFSYLIAEEANANFALNKKFSGKGYQGVVSRLAKPPFGQLRIFPLSLFPTKGLRACFHLSLPFDNCIKNNQSLARLEIWQKQGFKNNILATRIVKANELSTITRPFNLLFTNAKPGAKLEARMVFLSKHGLNVDRLDLGLDIYAHMKNTVKWYLDALGRVSLNRGDFLTAKKSFESLLAIDPHFRSAYLPLAKTLLDSGQNKEAYLRTFGAEKLFASQPLLLAKVRDMYQLMSKSTDVSRVDDRLSHLRPSLKYEARFATGLELLGYDLPKSKVAPGTQLDVNYYWRTWSKPPMNYFIFVHLRGKDRTVTFDHLLDHGRKNMTDLEPGEVIREDYQIQIPETLPKGSYKLVVGIWDPRFTGKGVPVIEGVGANTEEVELATVEII